MHYDVTSYYAVYMQAIPVTHVLLYDVDKTLCGEIQIHGDGSKLAHPSAAFR